MKTRNIIGTLLVIVSFGVLYPGLTKPALTVSASVKVMAMEMELVNETLSVLQTIEKLHKTNNDFVAGLILLFSVVVPIAKGVLLLFVLPLKNIKIRCGIHQFVKTISKWSMADVFVIALFLTFLSAGSSDLMKATLRPGFFYFTAYCLISLTASLFMCSE